MSYTEDKHHFVASHNLRHQEIDEFLQVSVFAHRMRKNASCSVHYDFSRVGGCGGRHYGLLSWNELLSALLWVRTFTAKRSDGYHISDTSCPEGSPQKRTSNYLFSTGCDNKSFSPLGLLSNEHPLCLGILQQQYFNFNPSLALWLEQKP